MYSSSSSVVAARAKGSLYHHQHQHQHHHHPHHHHRSCFSGDRVGERCGGCGRCCSLGAAHSPSAAVVGFSGRGLLASHNLLYGYLLRQSALIRWVPSRIIVSRGGGAGAAARYRRLTAAYDGDPCTKSSWRRWRKCGGIRISSTGAVFDNDFEDMLELTEESEEGFRNDYGAVAADTSDETCVKKKVGSKSYRGFRRHFDDKETDSSEEEDLRSSSNQRSASSFLSISDDSRRNKELRRRDIDEYNSKKEAREVQKQDVESRLRRRFHNYHSSDTIVDLDEVARKKEEWIGVKDDQSALRKHASRKSREQYVQKNQCFTGEEETKEESRRTPQVQQSSVADKSVDKTVVNKTKEDTSAAVLLDIVRRQQDEMIQLRKDYQDLMRTTQVNNVSATQVSASSSIFNARVENSGEYSTLPVGLLEEIQRQRNEIEKLNENYKQLMRAYKMQESHIIKEPDLAKSFGNREDNSASTINLFEKGTPRHSNMVRQTTDESISVSSILARTDESEKQNKQHKLSNVYESSTGTNINYGNSLSTMLEDRKQKVASTFGSFDKGKKHKTTVNQNHQNIGHINTSENSQNLTEKVDIHNDSTQIASTSERHHTTTTINQQEINLAEEMAGQVSSVTEQISNRRTDSRRKSQKLVNIVEIDKSGATKSSRTQDHTQSMVKDQEGSSMPPQLVIFTGDKRVTIDQHITKEINVSKDTQAHINLSVVVGSEAGNVDAIPSADGENVISTLNPVHEKQTSEYDWQESQQHRLRKNSQKGPSETSDLGPLNVSDSQASSSNMTESEDDYSSLMSVQETKEKQKVDLVEEALATSSGTSESWHTSGTMQANELDYNTESERIQLANADVLESAKQLAESSSHYIGEFVEQLQQKVSVSEETHNTPYGSPETEMELSQSFASEKSNAAIKHEDVVPKEDIGQHPSSSRVGSLSDEIWDVGGASSQKHSPRKELDDSSSIKLLGNEDASRSATGAIIKRSSKSLWSYIAEIIRMGWIARTSSEKIMLKTGAKNSPDESIKSDAWTSGHELEGVHEKNVKDEYQQSELNQATINKLPNFVSEQGRPELIRLGEKRMQEEIEIANSMGFAGRKYGSDNSPPAFATDAAVELEHIPSAVGTTSIHSVKETISMPTAATMSSQPAFSVATPSSSMEEMEIDRLHGSEVDFNKSEGQEASGISEVYEIMDKDVELKQRKLQRKKQVLKEEFEEWEEAYKHEGELRKIDEFFMREALLEAKKAADMWEVPVGAVLVKDGKIIARGCNLVEDLRDSTAHAEMICIREASNILKTWRLAGTTLYITLEPCPMCAGAILQARVDVVVWGAPNKLLGADGSWVRLFPGGGDEGKHGLDQGDLAVGPVHPFHPKISIRRGILAMECADAMQQFFQRRRKIKKPEPSPPSRLPVSYPVKILTKMHNIFSMMTCM